MKKSGLNGFPSWAQWNVSLWINNTEQWYCVAKDCIRRTKTRQEAAIRMLRILNDSGVSKTPDGAKYTITAIRGAMQDM